MKTTKTIEVLMCDMCGTKNNTKNNVKEFHFEYYEHDGDHVVTLCHETHLCVFCQTHILNFIAQESGGVFNWRPEK
jgi:S-adenosylmethionine/arginine decarboxylase-like enzyme